MGAHADVDAVRLHPPRRSLSIKHRVMRVAVPHGCPAQRARAFGGCVPLVFLAHRCDARSTSPSRIQPALRELALWATTTHCRRFPNGWSTSTTGGSHQKEAQEIAARSLSMQAQCLLHRASVLSITAQAHFNRTVQCVCSPADSMLDAPDPFPTTGCRPTLTACASSSTRWSR